MSVEENKALVRRFYEQVWNRGNVDVAAEVFAEGYVRHDLRPTQAAPGPAGTQGDGQRGEHGSWISGNSTI